MSLERLVSDYNCEMEGKHRTILRRHQSNLKKDLEPNKILMDLVEIFDEIDEGEIKAQSTSVSTKEKRYDRLLEILPTKGPNAFKVFVNALNKVVPHLASDLIEAGNKEQPNHHRLS